MKLSEPKRQSLYNATSEPIMDLRVWLRMHPNATDDEIDRKLYDLIETQWSGLQKVLNFHD